MNKARAPFLVTDLLRNMAARADESTSRPTNRKRSWKAPDKGSSKDEITKDALLGGPRDDSILQIDGSMLEGVGHVRHNWIITIDCLRGARYCAMQWLLAAYCASLYTSQRYGQGGRNQDCAPSTSLASSLSLSYARVN